MLAPGSNASAQTYTISQGSPAVITTITIDPTGGFGRHDNHLHERRCRRGDADDQWRAAAIYSAPSVSEGPATMLYVDGAINATVRAETRAKPPFRQEPL